MSSVTAQSRSLSINVGTDEDVYSEGLITYLLSSPLSKFSWLKNFKNAQNISSSFMSLDVNEQRLYARLFARQYHWIRFKRIKYSFIKDLRFSIEQLESKGLVTTDYSKEDIAKVLDILEKDEVKTLCKQQKVDSKGNKSEMIELLIKRCKTQRTIMSMFGNGASTQALLMKCIKNLLECVKLTDGPREFFMTLLLLVTYPHYRGEESKRVSDLAKTLFEKRKGLIVFHKYNLRPIDIFKNISRFTEFEKSSKTVDQFLQLKESKKWKEATELINLSKIDFIVYVNNDMNIQFLNQLRENDMDYLIKFTPGRHYAYILSKGIEVLKKEPDLWEQVVEILNMLLKQDYFLRGARGQWYRELALAYEKRHNYESMVVTLVEGFQDPRVVTNYSVIALIQKAESMVNRKALSLSAKELLLSVIPTSNYSAKTITITAVSVPNVSTIKKQMFVKNTEKGKEYSFVEEVARSHYSSELGFSSGIHDEGKLVVQCALACFWEVIFCDVEGVFHSELQTFPLDWGSSGFYKRRKDFIEEVARDIQLEGAETALKKNVLKYRGVMGPVDWEVLDGTLLEEAQSFLFCLQTDVFINIAKYLLEDFRSRRSGLPDLTLWDVESGRCCFAEVKGPSDTLSPNQIRWLEKLNEFGANAEVCRVNTLNTGPREKNVTKRKHEEIKSGEKNVTKRKHKEIKSGEKKETKRKHEEIKSGEKNVTKRKHKEIKSGEKKETKRKHEEIKSGEKKVTKRKHEGIKSGEKNITKRKQKETKIGERTITKKKDEELKSD